MSIKIIILLALIISYNCEACAGTDHCADCLCIPTVDENGFPGMDCDCKKWEDGYFFKGHGCIKSFCLYETCEKICVEGPEFDDCKICNKKENEIDECLECDIHAKLNEDTYECIPQLIKCGNKTFYDCEKCEEINDVSDSTEEKDYKCGKCRYHFILSKDGTCLYDTNFTKYNSSNNIIKYQYISISYIMLIYLLLLLY